MKIYKNKNILNIKTNEGYKSFSGIRELKVKELLRIEFDDNTFIEVTADHRFVLEMLNMEIFASDLIEGQYLSENKRIIKIKKLHGDFFVYDLLNVENEKYYTNDVLSHNCFIGSSQTLIEGKYIKEFKTVMERLVQQKYKPDIINLGIAGNEIFNVNIFEKPIYNHTYILGADGGEGIGGDASTFLVFDITDVTKINLVASYGNNAISTKEFSYLLTKVGAAYNYCYISIENNGITKSIVDDLWSIYEYDNIVTIAEKIQPGKVGISSTHNLKVNSCLWLKSLIQIEEINFYIRDPYLISEMEYFERKMGRRSIFQAVGIKHDDYMMAFIWAMKILDPQIIEDYYNVTKWMKTKLGLIIPERISQFYDSAVGSSNLIDDKFSSVVLDGGDITGGKESTNENQGSWDGPVAFFGDDV